jgi:(2R)-phospho-3-sulfolactate synthase (ComA)
MPSLARCTAFALRKYSTANSARTLPVAFPFIPVNALATKPNRNKGITEIRGPYYFPVTRTYLHELLSDWGEYVDGIKFAGGSFSLLPEKRLRDLIEVAHKHGALGLHLLYPTASIADGPSFLPRLLHEHWRLY